MRKRGGSRRGRPFGFLEAKSSSLLRLVNDGAFSCEYQPLVDPRSGEVGGYEALARFWIEGEEVTPGDVFQNVDEDPALFMVLESELKSLQIKHRPAGADLFLNIHPSICHQPQLMDHWVRQLSGTKNVVVEIVESSRLLDLELLHDFARRLRAAGIPCALDDVGSPHSLFSFELLECCSFIKLDRGWIERAQADPAYLRLLEGILAFAREKGIGTVLEGIELTSHLAWARQLEVDLVQGYRFSDLFQRPFPKLDTADLSGPISSLGTG
ncbi:MAG: EAL domain-containing protein [Myxococcota bacterium]